MRWITVFTFAACLLCLGPARGQLNNWASFYGVLPLRGSGPLLPTDWVVAAGMVTAFSPNLDKAAPSRVGDLHEEDAWLTIRVARAILRSKIAAELTVHYKTLSSFVTEEGFMPMRVTYLDWARFAVGDRLLVIARPKEGRLVATGDSIYPLTSYDDMHVKALEQYVRWDALPRDRLLDSIAATLAACDNPFLRERAMDLLSARAYAAGKRAWAVGLLGQAVRTQPAPGSADLRCHALSVAFELYSTTERGGVSKRVLDLAEAFLADATVGKSDKGYALAKLGDRAYVESDSRDGRTRVTFRQRALDIIERFIASERDQDLKRTAQAERDALLKLRARATQIVPD